MTNTATTAQRVIARLKGKHYGYSQEQAESTAAKMMAWPAGRIAAFLGDVASCSNCWKPPVANGRCLDCETLPSDSF